MKYTKEVKTALLAIIAVVLLIFGYSFLKGKNLLDSSRTFYAIYEDVEGLSPSSPVTINGLRVGSVTKIGFLNTSGDLLVTFNVENDFPFSKNSTAQVYGGGFIGGKSLAIVPEYEEGNLAKSGDTLPGEIEEGLLELVNDRLSPLQQKVEQAIVSADSLISSFNEVMNKDTRHNIRQTFEDISLTASSLKGSAQSVDGLLSENSAKLNRTFTNLDEMTGNLNTFSDTLTQVDIGRIVGDLEKVISDLESVSEKINNGDGTAAKLINDPSVYDNLEGATRQLDQLIQDVKLNPKRYVHFSIFGKNPGPYSPPKDSLK
ncbi:MlaD family protein [Salinimicrobium marinum]|uniref:MlaD family protein n=1 Tax=Salinimicrobium marinum TaxID=680283 RepID=UPI001678A9AB|nr:MlaD family protein [Salinimicrobium marinum]